MAAFLWPHRHKNNKLDWFSNALIKQIVESITMKKIKNKQKKHDYENA